MEKVRRALAKAKASYLLSQSFFCAKLVNSKQDKKMSLNYPDYKLGVVKATELDLSEILAAANNLPSNVDEMELLYIYLAYLKPCRTWDIE